MHIVIIRILGSKSRLYSKPMPLAKAEVERETWSRRHHVVAEIRHVPASLETNLRRVAIARRA
jgi:hypothetical protein